MKRVSAVLFAVATELSKLAKDSMPKMREGEKLCREWYENGIYCRESSLNGHVYVAEYDFRQRKSRLLTDDEVESLYRD